MKETVKVYTNWLNADGLGDLVRCSDCGELMLINAGGTICGKCKSENLMWYDEDKPEWTAEELETEGFTVVKLQRKHQMEERREQDSES